MFSFPRRNADALSNGTPRCLAWVLFTALVGCTSLIGCEGNSKVAPPQVPELTPEQKLEVVVGRLESLFQETRINSGLVVSRSITHRYLPASETGSSPIDIIPVDNTPVDSDPVDGRSANDDSMAVPTGEIEVVTKRSIALRPGEEQTSTTEEPTEPAPPVVHRSDSDTKKYMLSFREDRWQLDTQLTKESEKLWFEYALEKR
ncbi:hypothetical protein [Adhaeretor mobilis]|uniref:Uncharacterized protein n=1 Tax=Adhaeretor mobilis TaxID=1930276 RepID=A0A517MQ47_9BACT|nr:hypothetical protein [Adhaeretor mobilis]QDS96992.1 hypothetical protein HG15A2_02510 [Adhaeretor mobilis]